MQRFKFIIVAVLIATVLTACGTNKDNEKNNADNNNPVTENEVTDNNKDKNTDNNNADGLDNGVDHNGESRLDLAEDAADKVAELDEVDNATVIITDNNAYVAVVMHDGAEDTNNPDGEDALSKDLEDKIAEKVREVKSDVNNVYVSLNPDFVDRMRDYGTRISEGEPIEGFFDEFGEAIRNVFPDAH